MGTVRVLALSTVDVSLSPLYLENISIHGKIN